MSIALDATYSLGANLSGVGVYSRKILFGLANAHPEEHFQFCYRPNRYLRAFRESLPGNVGRRLLAGGCSAELFHALNQRVHVRARRVVTTFHDLFMMTSEYSSAEFRERFAAQARDAALKSDFIVAVSQFTADQVHALLGVDRSRIAVIPHGVDPVKVPTVSREKLVLFVGAIQTRKNVARLVRAFAALPQGWTLVLAGAPSGFGAAEELAAVEASSRKADIRVAGYVSTTELEALYARASIFAFPSLDEGFGIPILEAMARGVPVITSNRSAMPEVAGDSALLVDPCQEEEIAAALQGLAADEDRRLQLAELGMARAAQYPWTRAVGDTWRVYATLR